MLKKSRIFAISLLLPFVLFADDNIVIKEKGLYPEGLSYDAVGKQFFVSSVAKGEIFTVNKYGKSILFTKNKKFPSTLGLLVDQKHHQLLACVSDPGVGENSSPNTRGKLAGLVVYDIRTHKELNYYNLISKNDKNPHLANDVTFDDKDNIYVTDSFSPIIYKISNKGVVSIFAEDKMWSVKQGEFGLNGIVYNTNGYLIVAHYATHSLYKVDIHNPKIIDEIIFNKNNLAVKDRLKTIDGLRLLDKTTLALVSNNFAPKNEGNGIYKLKSSDNWKSANIVSMMKTGTTFPTTLTKKDSKLYVIHTKLPFLFGGNKDIQTTFNIEHVVFKNVKK